MPVILGVEQRNTLRRANVRVRHDQVHRIAFALDIARIGIHFVEEQKPRGHRAQAHCRIRACHHQHAAGEFLRQNRVPRIRRARTLHQHPQHVRLLDQRIDTLLRVALGHLDRGLNRHHRSRRLVNDVSGVAVTPDGKRAISASWDKTLKVWDLETGRDLRTLAGHSLELGLSIVSRCSICAGRKNPIRCAGRRACSNL